MSSLILIIGVYWEFDSAASRWIIPRLELRVGLLLSLIKMGQVKYLQRQKKQADNWPAFPKRISQKSGSVKVKRTGPDVTCLFSHISKTPLASLVRRAETRQLPSSLRHQTRCSGLGGLGSKGSRFVLLVTRRDAQLIAFPLEVT